MTKIGAAEGGAGGVRELRRIAPNCAELPRTVRRLDEHFQVVGDARELGFPLVQLCDVLADADDAGDLAVGIAARRGVEEDLDALALLRVQRELEVGRLLPLQRVL